MSVMELVFPGLASTLNVHPLFVHFPIALWATAVLFWGLALLRQQEELWRVGRWLLYLGSLGALAAVGTGLWAAGQMGHDSPGHDLVHNHRNWMLVASAVGLGAAAAAFVTRERATGRVRWLLLAILLIAGGLTVLGADRGALLVFRYGIGTQRELPPGIRLHEREGVGRSPEASAPSERRAGHGDDHGDHEH
jgi:uncharacterized membrane protein